MHSSMYYQVSTTRSRNRRKTFHKFSTLSPFDHCLLPHSDFYTWQFLLVFVLYRNQITQYVPFCVWLFLPSIFMIRFMHVGRCHSSLFISITVWCSHICSYHYILKLILWLFSTNAIEITLLCTFLNVHLYIHVCRHLLVLISRIRMDISLSTHVISFELDNVSNYCANIYS